MTLDRLHFLLPLLCQKLYFSLLPRLLQWYLYNLCNYVQLIWELFVAVGCLGPGQKGEEKQIVIKIDETILQCFLSHLIIT